VFLTIITGGRLDIPKNTIMGEHPAANQNGPEIPSLYPTRLEPNIAVDHSQDDITADAVKPVLTLRLAVMNLICY
jgi:hypothetical protein